MILFEEAKKIVLNTKTLMPIEEINFHHGIGRILAEDIYSDVDFPPFNKAAMDGFAVKEQDLDKELKIIETIAAGQSPKESIKQGETSRIMTGAPVPKGADFVIQVELSELMENNTVKFTGKSKNNIIAKASELNSGDIVLKKGDKIDARHIAILASVGKTEVKVYKQAKIGIITTGDEIIEPQNKPKNAQIRNSNGHQLIAQIIESGAIPQYYGIVDDSYNKIKNTIEQSLSACDVTIITGGISMGDFDYVPKILSELNINLLFKKIAVKPGKPTVFGIKDNKVVFGLPGNPVSSFVQFELLVKPFIYNLMGHNFEAKVSQHILAEDYSRKKSDRLAHLPVQIFDNKVYLSSYKGSAHIHALSESNGLIEIPMGVSELKKGSLINVRLF